MLMQASKKQAVLQLHQICPECRTKIYWHTIGNKRFHFNKVKCPQCHTILSFRFLRPWKDFLFRLSTFLLAGFCIYLGIRGYFLHGSLPASPAVMLALLLVVVPIVLCNLTVVSNAIENKLDPATRKDGA